MMLKGLKGGLWLELRKSPAADRPISRLKAPQKLYLPLRQYKGDLPVLSVSVGDHVYMGQVVARAADGISCPLHSPVSGDVVSITGYDHVIGGVSDMIVIENDGRYTPFNNPLSNKKPEELNGEEIIDRVKSSGAVSSDDFGAPLWAKLNEMRENKVTTVVINAVETEPYICTSQKIIDESPDTIAEGLGFIMKLSGAQNAVLAISDDIPHEISRGMVESAHLAGIKLKTVHIPQKYPYGYEPFLLNEVFSQEKYDVGKDKAKNNIGVVSAYDCCNVRNAVCDGAVQITRIITVAGDAVEDPQNLEVPIGTAVSDILEHCGLSFDPDRVVLGGAMRGVAVTDISVPVTKTVGAVLALKAARRGLSKSLCINCGKCVSVCPQGLMPNYIARLAVKADIDALHGLHIDDCIECGSCAYICPGHMPIVELIKNIKKAAL